MHIQNYSAFLRSVFLDATIFFIVVFVMSVFVAPFPFEDAKALAASSAASASSEATTFQVSGWIPYWQTTKGTADARRHLDVLTEINPFAFVVKEDGSLRDLADLKKSAWKRLIKSAHSKDVAVVPTVMWSDTENIQNILSNPSLRQRHIEEIVSMVKKGKYDGVDIDYEGKKSETKMFYAEFLRELKLALGSKILSCTIEARTPPDSLYAIIPADLRYANDYVAIGAYCDSVKIMAYDQQRADIKLNSSKKGAPYIPVADTDWVRKVVALAIQTIPKEKIMLGIPTYGREWEVTVAPDWFKQYKNLQALNPEAALGFAKDFNVTPSRNSAGELSFSYIPEYVSGLAAVVKSTNIPIPANTPSGNVVAAKALALANATGQPIKFSLMWWSDAEAVRQKVELAKQFGLGGVALFKIDGEEDEGIWYVLEDY